jgi:hypothetical protein
VQGSSLSPLLGNVYLHHVLDLWFEQQVVPRLRGKARLIRYCDDFVMTFQNEGDAKRVMALLGQRFQQYGLSLHPEKTRLLPFGRPPRGLLHGKGGETFDFLGFTVYWTRTRVKGWKPRFKTRKARLRRAFESVTDWCRRHRHQPVKEQHAALTRRLQGHMNYFGVNGNIHSIVVLIEHARYTWRKWLGRRGQRHAMSWTRFEDIERSYPLPTPRVCVQLWLAS